MEDYKEKKLKEYIHSSIKHNNSVSNIIDSDDSNISSISMLYKIPAGTRVSARGTVFFADKRAFIMDNTGSICLYGNAKENHFEEGDLISIDGIIKEIKGMKTLYNTRIKIVSSANKLPDPIAATLSDIADSTECNYAGRFIKIVNVKIKSIILEDTAIISDRTGHEIAIPGFPLAKSLSQGDRINFIGYLLPYNQSQIFIRKSEDIVKLASPEITNLKPVNMSSTFSTTPEVSAVLKDNGCEIDFKSIILYVDGEEVPLSVEHDRISFLPEPPLSPGEHNIKATARDIYDYPFEASWSFIIENSVQKYNFYFGVPHAHTCYSDGTGTPAYACEYAHRNGLDFLFIADHSNYFDGVTKNNYEFDHSTNQYMEHENSLWTNTRIETEAANAKYDDFVGLRGFEMTSSIWGHINVLNSSSYVEGKKQIRNLNVFFKWLSLQRDIVVSINHPGRSFRYLNYVPEMDGIINLIEVGNGAYPRKYKRTEKYYFDSLDRGWHFGAINGQDNHRDNWGDADNLTVILSEKLNKENLINALRHRRTYSTETRALKLLYKVNNFWMGSILEVKPGEALNFEIEAEDNLVPIERLQLISNGGRIIGENFFGNVLKTCWNPTLEAAESNAWYVVKVIHANGKWGTSSPIFTVTE